MFDIYYLILVVPAVLLSMIASFKVQSTFQKYSKVHNSRGLTGAEVARLILKINGINNVNVEAVPGSLTDHYDHRNLVARLSSPVYSSTSLAAIGVAAHEIGHAIQYKVGYHFVGLRQALYPAAKIGSSFGPTMAILGIIFRIKVLTDVGILFFIVAVLFYLVTLPVEFNASSRAIDILTSEGILTREEIVPVKKVLSAAAMTYVASTLVAMANLFRLILLRNSRD